jgi:hypothetical protein
VKRSAALFFLTLSALLWGCGGGDGSQSTSVGQPSAPVARAVPTVRCETAMGGTPPRSWRKGATAVGPVGFFGSGRDFLHATRSSAYYRRQWDGAKLEEKTPLIAEGHQALTVSIAPGDRSHARLQAPTSPPWAPHTEIRFVPCSDQPRTTWAAGFLLRDRSPVTVIVRQPGEAERRLQVGRV